MFLEKEKDRKKRNEKKRTRYNRGETRCFLAENKTREISERWMAKYEIKGKG